MQKLVWQNANGDSIDLTSGNYGITQWEGFSNTSLNIQSQQVPFQDGAVFLDALLNQRELSVTLKMQDNGNLEERYRMRRELIHILNPKLGEGYLIYTNDFISKRIKCVAQVPLFETHNSDTRGTPKASLSWTACEPYWEDLEETEVKLLDTENTIINNGDIPVSVKIVAQSKSGNIYIQNISTEKNIIINNAGTNIYSISTEVGKKNIFEERIKSALKGCFVTDAIIYKNNFYLINGDCIYKIENNGNYTRIYTNTKNELRSLVEKDGYVYLYEQYVGVRRTTDMENFETVLSVVLAYDYNYLSLTENGRLVLTTGGTNKYSDNGTNWSDYTAPTGEVLQGLIYVNEKSKYYCWTQNGFYSSSNMQSWTQLNTTGASSAFRKAIYNASQNKFLVSIANKVYTTTDFSTLTEVYTSTGNANIFEVNDVYILNNGTNLVKSTNLSTWEIVSGVEIKTDIRFAEYTNDIYFLILANADTIKSYNLNTFVPLLDLNCSLCRTSLIVDETNDGYLTGYTSGSFNIGGVVGPLAVVITPQLEIKYSNTSFSSFYSLSVVRFKNKFYAFNGEKIYESSDGVTYTQKGDAPVLSGYFFASEEKLFIYSTNKVYSSSNATTWIENELMNLVIYVKKVGNNFYAGLYNTQSSKRYIGRSTDCINFEIIQELPTNYSVLSISQLEDTVLCLCGYYSNPSILYKINNSQIDVVNFSEELSSMTVVNDRIYVTTEAHDEYNKIGYVDGNNVLTYKENTITYNNIKTMNNSLIMLGYNFLMTKTGVEHINKISNLESRSDMSFCLEVGNNIIVKNFNGYCSLKYRQKYLGV